MRRGIVVGFWVVPVLLGRLRGDVPWAGVAAVRGQGGVGYHELPVISEIFILGLAAGYLLQVRSVFFWGWWLFSVGGAAVRCEGGAICTECRRFWGVFTWFSV